MSRREQLPSLPQPRSPTLPPLQEHVLASGMRILMVERRDLPVVDVQVITRAGAYGDSAARAGRAALTATLLDEGTDSHDATEIADAAELLGATLQTRGSWDFCAAALHVLSPRLTPALELLAEAVMRPTFPERELERKRSERLAGIMQEMDEPRVLASAALSRLLYGRAHPFGSPLGGTRETVEALTRDDVLLFHRERFVPADTFMVVVGDVSSDALFPLAERLFGSWRTDATPAGAAGHAEPAPGARAIHIVNRPGAPQSEIRVGIQGPPRSSPDYFPLLVANTILGGSFTSRLNMRLREEKAYTYGAGSGFAFRAGGGPFTASTAVFTGATADAVNDIVQETRRLSSEAVPADELERARSYLVLGLPRTFETTSDVAEHIGDVELYGLGRDYYDRFAERVNAVSAEDVRGASERWLRADDLCIVIAGDDAVIRRDLESTGLGAVHEYEDG